MFKLLRKFQRSEDKHDIPAVFLYGPVQHDLYRHHSGDWHRIYVISNSLREKSERKITSARWMARIIAHFLTEKHIFADATDSTVVSWEGRDFRTPFDSSVHDVSVPLPLEKCLSHDDNTEPLAYFKFFFSEDGEPNRQIAGVIFHEHFVATSIHGFYHAYERNRTTPMFDHVLIFK